MFARIEARALAALVIVLTAALCGPQPARAQAPMSLAALEPAAPPPSRTLAEPFGLNAMPVTHGEILDKWNGIVADIRTERQTLRQCRDDAQTCSPAALKLLAVIDEGRAHDGRARAGVVNRAINLAIEPMSDLAQWGVVDRWSAPLVTLTTGRGDCEDYAIAKYVALSEAGVDEDRLRLVIVHDPASGEDHAVLMVRVEDKWLVLDNRRLAMLEDDGLRRFVPLFVLDQDGVRQFAPTGVARAPAAGPDAPAPSSLGF